MKKKIPRNVFSFTMEKDMKIMNEATRYHLDILGVSSKPGKPTPWISPTVESLLRSGPAMAPQAGVELFTSSRLTARVVDWTPLEGSCN